MVPEILFGKGSGGSSNGKGEYEMVGQDEVPDFPTPIVVTDHRGRAKWTVSIPVDAGFPLAPAMYADICAKCHEVAARVAALHSRKPAVVSQISFSSSSASSARGRSSSSYSRRRAEEEEQRYFLPISDAQVQGILPTPQKSTPDRFGGALGVDGQARKPKPACASSLTFVLESDSDAGLGTALLALWTAYGVAQREGRAFFVEDARWAYGSYTGLFEAPPDPGCTPPEWWERVPCPRGAKHLVVGAGSNFLEFLGIEQHGGSNNDYYDDEDGSNERDDSTGSYDVDDDDDDEDGVYWEGAAAQWAHRPQRQKDLFALARVGYEALFHLVDPDRGYVAQRIDELFRGKDTVGVHVRRGDRRPLEFQYADSYIPLNKYAETAASLLNGSTTQGLVVLASDDPLVYGAEELAGAVRAQELIRLAGKDDTEQEENKNKKKPSKFVMHKFVEETFGWEGGFFAAMFWNLGITGSSEGRVGEVPPASEETIRLRSLVGRAYLMDLAVVAAAEKGVVCAVSAGGCRVLAVMMGEERAFGGEGMWRNVDGGFGWSAFVW